MGEAPKLKVGDQLHALRSQDVWEPLPAVVTKVARKYAFVAVQRSHDNVEARIDMETMEFVDRWSPANYVFRSEDEWRADHEARQAKFEAEKAWMLLKRNLRWARPSFVTAADIQEAARLLGVDMKTINA